MHKKVQIITAILAKSFAEFKEKISKIEKYAPLAQIDVMDGKFVPETSFAEPDKIKTIITPCDYELHLMVSDQEKEIKRWLDFDKVQKIIFHIEAAKNYEKLIGEIKNAGKKVGLAINPEISAETIQPWISKIDNILVMGVEPGRSGQVLRSETFDKIRKIRNLNKDIEIEVDGGVNSENAPSLVEAGANTLVVGSFIFGSDNPAIAIKELQSCCCHQI